MAYEAAPNPYETDYDGDSMFLNQAIALSGLRGAVLQRIVVAKDEYGHEYLTSEPMQAV